jgi:hypothetical protein
VGVVGEGSIEGDLIVDPKADQHRYGHAGGQSENINERINFASGHAAQSNRKKVFDHRSGLMRNAAAN